MVPMSFSCAASRQDADRPPYFKEVDWLIAYLLRHEASDGFFCVRDYILLDLLGVYLYCIIKRSLMAPTNFYP